MPDLYLDELRMELLETCGVSVSESTIWRTLVKGGYSMKKVCN
jgi:transposase